MTSFLFCLLPGDGVGGFAPVIGCSLTLFLYGLYGMVLFKIPLYLL